ncbi:hypothetical protein Poli38472_002300 [Pythium oligandrum]|uniref:EGF-like domain-containing protein n=1 Tax=Pythium oligandrum TaxID=41045 RepID=A0A8K1FJP7_PYTOL|nr:hypothetical protein Poli38472_002300 [Pythium oligandrum]|eukprot:TMW63359.1 hypothetical protein Poli38472_002300 [Pythium oligandrum]
MNLRAIALLSLGAVAALLPAASAATETPKYTCETDADCEKNFANTVCIEVESYGEVTKKCTPNTKARPACRGAQPGLCPSYQSEDIGYLNVHCVFTAKDVADDSEITVASSTKSSEAASGSGSGSAKRNRGRFLMFAADAKVTSSASGESDEDVKVPEKDSTSTDTAGASNSDTIAKVKIGNDTVTGIFKCVDVSDCENQAYDPTTCNPLSCGPANSKTVCNNHGTCSYPSIQTMSKRACMCYKGYSGDKCEKEISNECDVDCGSGGDCIDGECKCKKGFDGKEYKGKKGKPNQRCTKCTNDLGCQNGNPCDISTGTCVCNPGYNGPTCGATEDSCVKKDCGIGSCIPFDNGTAACYCPLCQPNCEICKKKDCSTCPSPASTLSISKSVVFASVVSAFFLGNLVL